MNLRTDIQIGFPLAVEPWEFVIVKSTSLKESTQEWFGVSVSDNNERVINTSEIGAGKVLGANNHFDRIQGFRFYHISKTTSQRPPSRWTGRSDSAACVLALPQSKMVNDAPIILVSCACSFTPEGRLSGALLCSVSDSTSDEENGFALYQKWVSACQRQESIVGLVLLDSDIDILVRWLELKRRPIPPVLSVEQLDIMQLLTLPRSWPVLISVNEEDLPLLAERLGFDGRPFKPTIPREKRKKPEIRSGGYDRLRQSGRASWPQERHPAFLALRRIATALFSFHTLKIFSLSAAIIVGARWLLAKHYDDDTDQRMVLGDMSNRPADLLRPSDLFSPPTPPHDLAPSLPAVDLASKTPLRLPPGTIRQFGGCDMVLISAEVMPPGLVPFWIDRTEVTTEGFEKCVEAGRCNFDTATLNAGAGSFCNRGQSRAQHPMNCVTYDEAANYCSGLGKFVPTLAQWDYAARGDTARPYPWGETLPAADALCWKRLAGTCPVGQYLHDKSPFGVLGMGTNVGEWTSTKFYSDPNLSARVFRGWSWGTDLFTDFFGAKSHGLPAEKGQNNLGFRCARAFSETDQ